MSRSPALVRDEAQSETVAARGATAIVNLYHRPTVVRLLKTADAAIHAASPGDATSAGPDAAVADTAIDSFVHTGDKELGGSRDDCP